MTEWAIKDVSRATGVTSRTLRHYEQIGLLPEAALVDVARRALTATGFTQRQVLEARVLDLLTGS